ncbi:MAG: hypothetical protein WCG78_01915 [Candidatus Omnitrophota bacterium]
MVRSERAIIAGIAIVLGICCVLPQVLGYLTRGDRYNYFSLPFSTETHVDESVFYAPQAAYAMQTRRIPLEIDIYEYRHVPTIRYFLPALIEGQVDRWCADTGWGWLTTRFLFSCGAFLLAYSLAKKLSRTKTVACLAAVVFCTVGFGPQTFLNTYQGSFRVPMFFSRMDAPLISVSFLLAALVTLIGALEKRSFVRAVIAGLAGGSLFYTYYYYQVAYCAALFMMIGVYAVRRDAGKARITIAAGGIAAIVALPWCHQFMATVAAQRGLIARWSSWTYHPSTLQVSSAVVYTILLVIVYAAQRKSVDTGTGEDRQDEYAAYVPLYCLLGAALGIEYCITRFTTVVASPDHFTSRLTHAFTLLVFVCGTSGWILARASRYKRYCVLAIIILLMAAGVKQGVVWCSTRNDFMENTLLRGAQQLVRERTIDADVIGLRDAYVNSIFPARLWRFRFYTVFRLSSIGSRENLMRYVFLQKMFDVPWNVVEDRLLARQDMVRLPVSSITVALWLSFERALSAPEAGELKIFYGAADRRFLTDKKLDYVVCLEKREADALVSGANKMGIRAELDARRGDAYLFRIKKEPVEEHIS